MIQAPNLSPTRTAKTYPDLTPLLEGSIRLARMKNQLDEKSAHVELLAVSLEDSLQIVDFLLEAQLVPDARKAWLRRIVSKGRLALAKARDDTAVSIPAFLRDALKEKMAYGRLMKAAQALLDEETACAESSYREYDGDGGWTWNDEVWRESDPKHFKLCREVRLALRECRRLDGGSR